MVGNIAPTNWRVEVLDDSFNRVKDPHIRLESRWDCSCHRRRSISLRLFQPHEDPIGGSRIISQIETRNGVPIKHRIMVRSGHLIIARRVRNSDWRRTGLLRSRELYPAGTSGLAPQPPGKACDALRSGKNRPEHPRNHGRIALGAVALAVFAACGHTASPTHTLTVTASGACGSSDWAAGMSQDVQVRDPSNKLIGTAGMYADGPPESAIVGLFGSWCVGSVSIPDVPQTSLYRVKIGTLPGTVTFHLSQLRKSKWVAAVSISWTDGKLPSVGRP